MTDNLTYGPDHSSIYPGEYEPEAWKEKELQDEIKSKGSRIIKPPVNIIELEDHYMVEMAAPGFKREDIFIFTEGRVLIIAALNKKPTVTDAKHTYVHTFHCERVHRRIRLPLTTDTNFTTAEYRNGILTIYLFKSKSPVINQPGSIVVY